MNSRERVEVSLCFQQPDRVPVDLWVSSGFRDKLERTGLRTPFQQLLDLYDVDFRYIEGPKYVGPAFRQYPNGSQEDLWGVVRTMVKSQAEDGEENYWEVKCSPLAGATAARDVDRYPRWPSPDWFDYSQIEAQCDAIRAESRIVVFMGDRLNRVAQLKPAMYLRGVEQILVDMASAPKVADAIFGRIRDFYAEYAERILSAANGKIDILLTGDDFGTQNGPLISPRMWLRFLGNGFLRYASLGKRYGARIMHHTCGSVRSIIPLMIDRGLDILQSIQPEAADMAPAQLKREFGNQLAFHGGISIQQTLPYGTPEDVRNEVRNKVQALAPGGGYILCTSHNIQADTPLENFNALMDAYAEFAEY